MNAIADCGLRIADCSSQSALLIASLPRLEEIQAAVAGLYGVTVKDLLLHGAANSRRKTIVRARHLAMVLCRFTGASYAEIGDAFGADHGTVMHACNQVAARLGKSGMEALRAANTMEDIRICYDGQPHPAVLAALATSPKPAATSPKAGIIGLIQTHVAKAYGVPLDALRAAPRTRYAPRDKAREIALTLCFITGAPSSQIGAAFDCSSRAVCCAYRATSLRLGEEGMEKLRAFLRQAGGAIGAEAPSASISG